MAKVLGWLAVAVSAGAILAFHRHVPEVSFALAFFVVCALSALATLAVAVHGRTWDTPPAPGRIVAVLPAFNEDPAILHRAIDSLLAGSVVPDVLHVMDDGSAEPLPVYEHPRVVWHRQPNMGKRHAQINALAGEAACDFILTLDSDTLIDRDTLLECLRPLADERVMASTATVAVLNRSATWLTQLVELEIVSGCLVNRGARSALGAVAPTAGTFTVYRAPVILDNVEDYLRSGTVGDDRRLTHYALLRGQVVSSEAAVVFTHMPERVGELFAQRTRWFKSYFRYLPWELRNLDGPAFWFRAWNFVLLVTYPFLVLWLLLVMPASTGTFFWQALAYWLVLLYCQTSRYLTYKRSGRSRRERVARWLLGTPWLIPLNLLVIRPAQYYAAFRARTTHWHTRGDHRARTDLAGERA